MNQPIRVPPAQRVTYHWGPVTKQRGHIVSLNVAPDAAISLLNCWIRDSDTDYPTVEGRPGFYIADETLGSIAVQWVGQLSKSDGTEVSALVAGGEIYTYTWGTDTLAKVVTTANLTTASVTLSATARVHACEFADTLVFNDDTNRPFTWDGTTGAGGVVSLTNGPSRAYGRPWVRAAKLFFIKYAERSTIVWSAEGTANTGYEAGGYSNAWTLRQTATEGFFGGRGTNDGMYLFRGGSTTFIRGEVTSNFSSTADDEGVDEHVGCVSPSAILNVSGSIYFLSSDRRVMRSDGGGPPIDVSVGARVRLAALNYARIGKAFLELMDFAEQGERLILGIPDASSDDCSVYVIINPQTGLCEGTWTGWTSTALGSWKNANGEWRLVHGGGDTASTVDDGMVYIHDVPSGFTVNDEFPAGASPIAHEVETTFIGADANVEKTFTQGTVLFHGVTTLSGVQATITTPRASSTLTTPLAYASMGGFVFGVAVFGIAKFGAVSSTARVAFGTRGVVGRSARVRLSHSVIGERFAVQEITLDAVATGRRPTAV